MKVTFLGEGRVGKTSLITRVVKGSFDPDCESSLNAAKAETTLVSSDKTRKVTLKFWDTAGQEQFRCISPMYYRDADVILIVYNTADLKSFTELDYWINEVKEKAMENSLVIIVGNQCDRLLDMAVDPEQGQTLANKFKMPFYQTSAKTGQGIIEMIKDIVAHKFPDFWKSPVKPKPEISKNPSPPPVPISAVPERNSIRLNAKDANSKGKKKCGC